MDSFGTKLKREREKRQITLEDVSISTKIGTRFLQALESDRFQELPGGIFNKGFVRAYARHLGLDEERTLSEFALASGEEAPVQPGVEHPPAKPKPAREKVWEEPAKPTELPWGYLIIALILVGFGLAFWGISHQRQSAETTVAPAKPAAGTNPAATSPPPSSAPASVPAVTPPQRLTAPAATTPPPGPAAAKPSAPAGAFTVTLFLREDSWISAIADGEQLIRGTLPANSQRTLHARNQLTVTAGNAGAIDLTFNGKPLPAAGAEKEVKTLTFTSQGLLSSTAPAISQ